MNTNLKKAIQSRNGEAIFSLMIDIKNNPKELDAAYKYVYKIYVPILAKSKLVMTDKSTSPNIEDIKKYMQI